MGTQLEGGIMNLQAVGKEVVEHVKLGDERKQEAVEHYKKAGQLLLDVSATQAKDFERFLKRECDDLHRSRAYELMQIAGGRKTVEQIRAETRKRVARHREKKRRPLQDNVTDKIAKVGSRGEPKLAPSLKAELEPAPNMDPEVEAKRSKREPESSDPDACGQPPKPQQGEPATESGPPLVPSEDPALQSAVQSTDGANDRKSKRAFAEFKYAADRWLPRMNPADRQRAGAYVNAKVTA